MSAHRGDERFTRGTRRPLTLPAPPAWMASIPTRTLRSNGVAGYVEHWGLPRPTLLELLAERKRREAEQ